MQRRAYVPGVAALLAALLAGCTGGSGEGSPSDDSNPGSAGTASPAARPGRYATLPEPCGAIRPGTLDELLPGIGEMTDATRRTKAYAGEATLTYDTDRKVGCSWKVESAEATNRLVVDFERIVSYDNAVSDDSQAQELFAAKRAAAGLPEPTATGPGSAGTGGDGEDGDSASAGPDASSPPPARASDSPESPGSSAAFGVSGADAAADSRSSGPPSGETSSSTSPSGPPADLRPRLLDEFGDEGFLDDELSSSGSTVKQRSVTVAFRTSNVIVTIEYAEQPATVGAVPDSEEMQDRARKLASLLADSLGG